MLTYFLCIFSPFSFAYFIVLFNTAFICLHHVNYLTICYHFCISMFSTHVPLVPNINVAALDECPRSSQNHPLSLERLICSKTSRSAVHSMVPCLSLSSCPLEGTSLDSSRNPILKSTVHASCLNLV